MCSHHPLLSWSPDALLLNRVRAVLAMASCRVGLAQDVLFWNRSSGTGLKHRAPQIIWVSPTTVSPPPDLLTPQSWEKAPAFLVHFFLKSYIWSQWQYISWGKQVCHVLSTGFRLVSDLWHSNPHFMESRIAEDNRDFWHFPEYLYKKGYFFKLAPNPSGPGRAGTQLHEFVMITKFMYEIDENMIVHRLGRGVHSWGPLQCGL